MRCRLGYSFILAAISLGAASAATAQVEDTIAPIEEVTNFESGGLRAQLVEATPLIRAQEARDTYEVNGAGLTVGVMDTGINTTHVDFAGGRIIGGRNYTSDYGGNVNNFEDGQGHGSNCAGIVMANGKHVGVAPGANVYAYKVLSNSGSGTWEGLRDALAHAISNHSANNISVLNLSLGGSLNYTSEAGISGTLITVRDHINTLRSQGVVVCISAGNDFFTHGSAQGMGFPGICASSTSVGAVYDASMGGFSYTSGAEAFSTGPKRITPFSQRLHDNVSMTFRTDMFAPGAAMTSTGVGSNTMSSTMHGTSQASPCLAGVVLLMQEYHLRHTGSLPSVDNIELWLRQSSESINDGDDEDDNVTNTGLNYRLVDAFDALETVRVAIGAPPPNSPPTVDPIASTFAECEGEFTNVVLTTFVDDPDGDGLTVDWYVDGAFVRSETVPASSNVEFDYDYPHGESLVTVEVTDGTETATESAVVTVDDTTAPIVVVAGDLVVPVDFGEIVATNVALGTPDVHDECDDAPVVVNNAPAEFPIGETTVLWTVTDAEGNVGTAEQKVLVVNAAPVAEAGRNLVKQTTRRAGTTATLNGSGSSDDDGHDLTYLWEADGVSFDDPTSPQPQGNFPVGTTTVRLTVTDEAGDASSDTVVVNVVQIDVVERRPYGFYANYYAYYAYYFAYYSVANGNYASDALTGYECALYGYLYGQYAGDRLVWGKTRTRSEALGEYVQLRYYQYLYNQYSSQYLSSSYAASGDTLVLYAWIYASYAQYYGEYDLTN